MISDMYILVYGTALLELYYLGIRRTELGRRKEYVIDKLLSFKFYLERQFCEAANVLG